MPAMIKVVASFHAPESAIATSLTFYVLGGATLQLLLGPLSDRYGRRPVMLFGATFFFICTALIACSQSINQFLIGRFFEGMGLCFIFVVGYASLQEIFAEMDAIRLIAIMANVSILAPLIGPLAGAAFITYFNWRFIFVTLTILSLIVVWGLWRFMPESLGQMKRDGELIKPTVLSFRVVVNNYKRLLTNKRFMAGVFAYSVLGVPCIVWIALSPVLLVTESKLTLLQYGSWQIPVFAAFILGNVVLSKLTYLCSLPKIRLIGSCVVIISLLMMYCLPLFIANNFIWLMPGLICYCFGYSLVATPLTRFILFLTDVSKSTTSAVISMLSMCIQAIGIEIVNHLHVAHHYRAFGFYCAVIGVIYFIFARLTDIKSIEPEGSTQ